VVILAREQDMLIQQDETLDRLTSRLHIIQKRRGHRAASDDTLLAWAATRACPGAVRVLDLGSGKGTVAMLLLQRLPGCRVIGLEALEISHELAVRNAHMNALTDRWQPQLGDLREAGILAGESKFDLITGAPPFMPVGSGLMPEDPQRAAGRFELRGGVRDYAEAAVRYLAQGGKAVFLMDGLESSRVRAAQAFTSVGLAPHIVTVIRPFPGRDPVYRIFETSVESGATTEQSFCMRIDAGGGFSPEYEAIRRDMDCASISSHADSETPGAGDPF
jgi:tRNA1Val (adenine37-N6)-methyltransferase